MHQQQSFDWDKAIEPSKRCGKCGEIKTLSSYAKDSRLKSGLQAHCKDCKNAVSRQWRRDNPEKVKAHWAKWAEIPANKAHAEMKARLYREATKADTAKRSKAWALANPDRTRARVKAHAAAYPERRRKSIREWQKRNLDYGRASKAKRKAALLNATPSWADAKKIAEFYSAANFLSMVTGEWYHVDHIVPLQGPRQKSGPFEGERLVYGLHCESNLQVLCGQENMRKHNRHWPDMP